MFHNIWTSDWLLVMFSYNYFSLTETCLKSNFIEMHHLYFCQIGWGMLRLGANQTIQIENDF